MTRTDKITGIAAVAVAAFFAWRTTLIEEPFISDPLGPRVFPLLICAVLGLAGLAMALRPDPEPEWPALRSFLEIAAGIVIFIGYAQLLPELGFVISTFFAAGFLAWRLGAVPIGAIAAGAGISLGIYAVFNLILGLSLAKGPFGF